MRTQLSITLCALLIVIGGICCGCGSSAATTAPGYTKDDFKKVPPPPGYKDNPGRNAPAPAGAATTGT